MRKIRFFRGVIFSGFLINIFSLRSWANPAAAPPPVATEKSCQRSMQLTYARGNAFSLSDSPILSFKPEPGSIENRFPGTIRRLISARIHISHLRNTEPNAFGLLTTIADDLERNMTTLKVATADLQMDALLDSFAAAVRTELLTLIEEDGEASLERAPQFVTSLLWKLTVACLFKGEEFYFSQKASHLLGLRSSKNGMLKGFADKQTQDRVIDFAVKDKEGWRWFEAHDWSMETARLERSQQILISKFTGQHRIRSKIKRPIRLILLLKYKLDDRSMNLLRSATKYDDIFTILPEGNR